MEYVFNGFSLDTKLSSLSKSNVRYKLEPRVFQLLLYFCKRSKQAITREELIKYVWQNRVVGYAAINRAIGELRKVIEEDVTDPKIIITVSKVGYLFDAQIMLIDEERYLPNEKLVSEKPEINEVKAKELCTLDFSVASKKSNKKTLNVVIIIPILLFTIVLLYLFIWRNTVPMLSLTLAIEKPLTTLKGTSFKGDLSASGQDLVFLHKEKANDRVQVWLQKEGKKAERLTNDDTYYTYVIYADDAYVLASRFNNLEERNCEIVKVSLLNKVIESVFNCADRAMTNLSFHVESNTLFFNYRRSITSVFNIYSYQLDTKAFKQLTFSDVTADHGDFTLALSPSGNQLAVLEYRDKNQAILKFIALNGSDNKIVIGPTFSANSHVSWLSDSQLLLTDGDQLKQYDLLTQKTSILGVNTNYGYARAHALTKKIIFDKGKVTANIYQYPLLTEQVNTKQAVTNSSFINYEMKFSNLSKSVSYLSTDSGEAEIIIKLEGQRAYNAKFPGEISTFSNFDWSASDDFLMAGVNQKLYLYDINKQKWQLLLSQENSVHYVSFIDEGNIAFSSNKGGQWQIWGMNLPTKSVTQLTTQGGYSIQFGENKRSAYITKYNSPGIFQLDLETNIEKVLLPEYKITAWKKWQIVGQKLYYIKEQSLYQFDFTTQISSYMSMFELKTPGAFSVSFDHSVVQRELVEASYSSIWVTQIE
ncbi:hypothetical protein CXF85_20080 [Colwellia sp. 75C3]|uniref:winged helix-turn-helix domain-containing protein n=1 Tax=Colwellia sp. 75C3 TaxID=888425 RepID=UPI000C33B0FF|nr:winged helix-turn-helix domain-containing protein [Colwellia sp. 75C3]PKG81062.1 hypothetical protein CXF85_20080 [Colwellia sp. 75C3]